MDYTKCRPILDITEDDVRLRPHVLMVIEKFKHLWENSWIMFAPEFEKIQPSEECRYGIIVGTVTCRLSLVDHNACLYADWSTHIDEIYDHHVMTIKPTCNTVIHDMTGSCSSLLVEPIFNKWDTVG